MVLRGGVVLCLPVVANVTIPHCTDYAVSGNTVSEFKCTACGPTGYILSSKNGNKFCESTDCKTFLTTGQC